MIQELKIYLCDRPHEDEIRQAMEISKRDNCIIELRWFVEYSGWYKALVEPGSTIQDVEKQIPKMYGI